MKLKLHAEWSKRIKLRAEGDKLRAEGDKLLAEGDKLWAEGDKQAMLDYARLRDQAHLCRKTS